MFFGLWMIELLPNLIKGVCREDVVSGSILYVQTD